MGKFDKFNKAVTEETLKSIEEAKKNTSTNIKVPSGEYKVTVANMNVGETDWGTEQINIDFEILEGDYKKQHIFYNGTFTDHFAKGIFVTSKLLECLTDGELTQGGALTVLQSGATNTNELLLDVMEEIEGYEYDLKYEEVISTKINDRTGKPYLNKFYSIK